MDPLAGFAQHLRSLREAQGLSVRGLADRVGVSSVTIWKWERGDSKPRPNLLLSLARALDVTPFQLNEARAPGDPVGGSPDALARPGAVERTGQADAAGAGGNPAEPLADVIARAKQMIADASGTGPGSITILIEY